MPYEKVVSGLLISCSLFVARIAAADAKQCVTQNNDGADRRAEHHLLAARDAYRACVAEPECPAVVRDECDAALTDLKTAIPTVLISIVDQAQHDVAGATLLIDGKSVPVDGSAMEFDPGAHELVANSGSLSTTVQLVAIENDRNRRVELRLVPPVEASPLPALTAEPPRPAPRSLVPSYILGGVGVLGAASFSYFALSGHSEFNRLQNCKPNCQPDDVREVRTRYLLADISLGVSVAALVSAGYLFFHTPPPAPSERSALSLSVAAVPGATGFSVRWEQ